MFLERQKEYFRPDHQVVYHSILEGHPEARKSTSVMEAVLVGISLNLDYLETLPNETIRQMYDKLLVSEEFSDTRLRAGLSSAQRVSVVCPLPSGYSPDSVMVNKGSISRNLRELDTRYNRKTRNLRDPLYYSKLALLELCGWIEVTMDGIVLDCAQKHLTRHSNLNYVQDSIIHRTFGLHMTPNSEPC